MGKHSGLFCALHEAETDRLATRFASDAVEQHKRGEHETARELDEVSDDMYAEWWAKVRGNCKNP